MKARFIEECLGELEVMCPRGVVAKTGHSGHGTLHVDFHTKQHSCSAILRVRDVEGHLKSCSVDGGGDRAQVPVLKKRIQELEEQNRNLLTQDQAWRDTVHRLEDEGVRLKERIMLLKQKYCPPIEKCGVRDLVHLGYILMQYISSADLHHMDRDALYNNLVALEKDLQRHDWGDDQSDFETELRMVATIALSGCIAWTPAQRSHLAQIQDL